MTGIRIVVDYEALVHENWKRLPWRVRARAWLLRTRKGSEAEAVRRLRGEPPS
jgi:hypothetical protein